jgi:hypothetical protein
MTQPAVAAVAALALLASGGCATNRSLKITEVSLDAVELHLDEPVGNGLALSGMKLVYLNSAGLRSEVDLFGAIDGAGWLVVWEAPANLNVTAPTSLDYVNFFNRNVPGIAVPTGFFSSAGADTFAYRVSGRSSRFIFPFFLFYFDVDDVVKFGGAAAGPAPRPSIGGAFAETNALGANRMREPAAGITPARTISRKWDSGTARPIDTDSESDWSRETDSLGRATP